MLLSQLPKVNAALTSSLPWAAVHSRQRGPGGRRGSWAAGALLRLALAGVLTLACGCSGDAAPTSVPVPSLVPSPPPAAATVLSTATAVPAAKVVTLVMDQEPDTLFPYMGLTAARAVVLGAVGAPLTRVNERAELIPWIAESVPTLDNGGVKWVGEGADKHLEVTYKLRKNVRFQDGTLLTAKDVRFTWELNLNPDFANAERSAWQKVWDVDTPDDYTVVARYMSEKNAAEAVVKGHRILNDPAQYARYKAWKGPVVDALYATLWGDVLPSSLLSKLAVKDLARSDFSRKPVLAGPYRVQEWVPGQQIILKANPDFFLGQPKIETVVFKFVRNSYAVLAALQAGEADVATQIGLELDQAPELDRLAQAGMYKIWYVPGDSYEQIDFNLSNPLLGDLVVRQALAYAIDRQSIADRLLYGKAKVADSYIMSYQWPYCDGVVRYPYDPAKARTILDEAGYKAGADGLRAKGGRPLAIKLQFTDSRLRLAMAQMLQQNLRDVGIKLDLDLTAFRDFFAPPPQGLLYGRTFQSVLLTGVTSLDPGGETLWSTAAIPSKENNWEGQNYPGWKNTKANGDAEILVNQKERAKLYCEHQKLYTQDIPALPLVQSMSPRVVRVGLQGFKPPPAAFPETWNVFEWTMSGPRN